MRWRQSPSRRWWTVLSLPVLLVLGFLLVNVGSALGLETSLERTFGVARDAPPPKATGTTAGSDAHNPKLETLRKRAKAAREELEQATTEYRRGRQRLEEARQRLQQKRSEVSRAEARLRKLRESLEGVANAAYQDSRVSGFARILTSENPRQTMRAAVDFAKLNREQQAAVREVGHLLQRRQALQANARHLAERAQARAAKLKKEKQQLKKKSRRLTDELMQRMRRMGLDVSPGERLPLSCQPEKVNSSGYANGLIPQSALCPLAQGDHALRADAATAFAKLNVAYARRFGEALCVTDAYRSLDEQQRLYASKPGLAAVPGTSNHGRGLAVDLCGGVDRFGTEQFEWMQNHAPDYGWIHPDWASAGGSMPEPWHWEYTGGE